ncbi:MAG: LacI family DNA-binding transcriptional regulator, partial [Porcincola intestinalis]
MTIRELAGEIGVSPATISMVLNDKGDISEQTRAKVLEAVERYGYSPKRRKVVLRNRILLIQYRGSGYLVEENQGFISAIIDAIEKNLKNEGYGLSIVNISGDLREELEAMSYDSY